MVSRNIKAIPLFVTLLLSVLYVLFNPDIANALSCYLDNKTENGFIANHGWSLYAFLIPAIGAVLGRPKVMWRYIVIMVVFPIALCFSYWLWELLGWLVMGVVLSIIVALFSTFSDEDLSDDWAALAMYFLGGAYLVLRVICYFANDALLPFFDVAFMGLSALVCVADTAMVFVGWIPYKSQYHNDTDLSAHANFYYFIAFVTLLFVLAVFPLNVSNLKMSAAKTYHQTTDENTTTYVCKASTLNVRNMPNPNARTLGKIKKGERVEVYRFVNGFAEIKYAGKKGYVSEKYLSGVAQYKASSSTSNSTTKTVAQTTPSQTTPSQTQQVNPIPADARQLHAGHMTSKPRVDESGGDNIYAVTQGPGYITVWFVVPRFSSFEVSSRTYLIASNGSQKIKLKVKEMGEWTREKGYTKFKLNVHHEEDYSSDRLFGLIFDEIDPSITTISVKDEKRNWAWTGIHLKPSN